MYVCILILCNFDCVSGSLFAVNVFAMYSVSAVSLSVAGHSSQTSSDWQWLHNYGTLLRATDALAKRTVLPPSVFYTRAKEHNFTHSARHPLVRVCVCVCVCVLYALCYAVV